MASMDTIHIDELTNKIIEEIVKNIDDSIEIPATYKGFSSVIKGFIKNIRISYRRKKIELNELELRVRNVVRLITNNWLDMLSESNLEKVFNIYAECILEDIENEEIYKIKNILSEKAVGMFEQDRDTYSFISIMESISSINTRTMKLFNDAVYSYSVIAYSLSKCMNHSIMDEQLFASINESGITLNNVNYYSSIVHKQVHEVYKTGTKRKELQFILHNIFGYKIFKSIQEIKDRNILIKTDFIIPFEGNKSVPFILGNFGELYFDNINLLKKEANKFAIRKLKNFVDSNKMF